ncbi:unnamed protein product [Closterium sp. NIES-54]
MDVWGPARVRGQGHERYFLLVVDDYSRYTTVFPLRRKGEVTEVLIDWIRAARLQLSESFGSDLPVLRLHSYRGGEFSSDLLRAFSHAEGIRQTFRLPTSPQKNGIAERRIGMVMDVARTSMIHAAAPHFLWPFALLSAMLLRTSCPPVLVPCVFLGFPPDAPGWQFYHPTSRRALSSQDVTFDESVSYYRLFPYRTAPLPPPPLFLAPGAPPVDPLPPQGPAPSGVSQVDPVELVEVAVDSGAARGAEPAGAGPEGAEPGVVESEGAEPGGAEPERVELGGVEPGGTESGGAERGGVGSRGAEPGGAEPERAESGGPLAIGPAARGASGARAAGGPAGAGAAGAAGPGGAGAAGATGPGGAGAGGTGTVGGPIGVGAAGAAGAGGAAGVGAVGAGAVATGGAAGAGAVGGTGAGGAVGVVVGDPGAEGTGAVSAVSGGAALAHVKAQRTINLTQSHMVQQVLQRFGFTYSSPQSTPLPTGHSLSAPPSDESVEPNGPYPELVGCLMYLMTCKRPDLAYPLSLLARYVAPSRQRKVHWDAVKRVLRYLCSTSGMGLMLGGRARVVLTGHADASWVDDMATQQSSQGYTCSPGSDSVSWRSTLSSSVLSSSCEAEIYGGAMAVQELRWLTYLLTDLGEAPRSPPVLYVDNKAMLALCQEHRLEHRTKPIALRYFLARELQQRGQFCLAYVASQANTVDVFHQGTSALLCSLYCLMRGDVVIHPELALPFLTRLVTSCSPPLCLWGFPTCTHLLASSVIHSFTILTMPARCARGLHCLRAALRRRQAPCLRCPRSLRYQRRISRPHCLRRPRSLPCVRCPALPCPAELLLSCCYDATAPALCPAEPLLRCCAAACSLPAPHVRCPCCLCWLHCHSAAAAAALALL